MRSEVSSLRFPYAEPPAFGEPVEVADGILWTRLPLPFRLDHVNLYLIEDEGGWAVLDTGVDTPACRQVWESLLAGVAGASFRAACPVSSRRSSNRTCRFPASGSHA